MEERGEEREQEDGREEEVELELLVVSEGCSSKRPVWVL